MPSVHVYLWAGRNKETKKKLIVGITQVFTDLNIPKEAVEVILHDIPKENWGLGGEPASEKFDHLP